MVTVSPSQFATRRTLFHVLVGCVLLMLKVSRLKLPYRWLFFFNDTATTEIYTLSLHDALPISRVAVDEQHGLDPAGRDCRPERRDRKSTRLNSSHAWLSYAVSCLKKKKQA